MLPGARTGPRARTACHRLLVNLIAALRTFARVAEVGSFSAVAQERGVTQPAVSRQVTSLEEALGVRLVHRSTQAVSVTEEGRTLLDAVYPLLESADGILNWAAHRRGQPTGTVRVSSTVGNAMYFSRHLPKLLTRHPELTVELTVRDRTGNLVEEGFDLEVGLQQPADASLVSRVLGVADAAAVVAPTYLKDRRAPVHPTDLAGFECLVATTVNHGDCWRFRHAHEPQGAVPYPLVVPIASRYRTNSAAALYSAVLAGHGIAILPYHLVADDIRQGALVRLFGNFACEGWTIYVSYPSHRRVPPRTRAVIDFLLELFDGPSDLNRSGFRRLAPAAST